MYLSLAAWQSKRAEPSLQRAFDQSVIHVIRPCVVDALDL